MLSRLLIKALKRSIPKNRTKKTTDTPHPINTSLQVSIQILEQKLGNSSDFIVRKVPGRDGIPEIAVCYIEGLVDMDQLNGIMEAWLTVTVDTAGTPDMDALLKKVLPARQVSQLQSVNALIPAVLEGKAVILIDGLDVAYSASVAGLEKRSIVEPSSQTVIRGPKDGFTEDISTNLSLIRRRLRTPDLRIQTMVIGKYTNTRVTIAHIEGIADPQVVSEIMSRLHSIDTDSVLESGYIEEFIQDASVTSFPTMINTERPDAVAGSLLEGQVAILIDGSPFVLIAPVTFFKFLHSSEDYYQRYDLTTFLRAIRFVSLVVSLLLPSLYIAFSTFNQEMIPTPLLISLAAQREGTPLPALVEAFMMELTFEIIREAGVRMPRVIGPAISIVGALVLGQAAVQAGLVSGAMVIVVSFTAIANFAIPAFSMAAAIRLIRFVLMLLAGTLGLFGILAGIVPLYVHLVSLTSFGVPYLSPMTPLRFSELKDLFVRLPWPLLKTRPKEISQRNLVRQNENLRSKDTRKDQTR
ncbi:spore germination protein [Paenibacillus sp. Dod16]|uniref:spore germination protein n=1 Tax=Paenibacillus sp. Dod16 TaxID=3416392 RepID=UPI003CE97A30